ncbi:hypothetical protein ACH5RR_009586, partial [Cinchona calisaya]
NYSRFIKNEKPLPSWSTSDVEDFIASIPVLGPVLKTARDAVKYGAVGSNVGAVTTAGWAWKYSRSLHGAGLSLAAGTVFGWTFRQETANHHLQLYRLDTMAARPNSWNGGRRKWKIPLLLMLYLTGKCEELFLVLYVFS